MEQSQQERENNEIPQTVFLSPGCQQKLAKNTMYSSQLYPFWYYAQIITIIINPLTNPMDNNSKNTSAFLINRAVLHIF